MPDISIMQDILTLGKINSVERSIIQEKTEEYLSHLPKNIRDTLFKLYEEDFILGGYDFTP